MTLNWWFDIIEYRIFHDAPRLILVANEVGDLWIMDCQFDDELDEYPDSYDLFFIGKKDGDTDVLDEYVQQGCGEYVQSVRVKDVEFDESRRKKLRILPRSSSGLLTDVISPK